MKSAARKEQCLQVPGMFLEPAIQKLDEPMQQCGVELVLNLSEVDISD
jgi:hypothetical protein